MAKKLFNDARIERLRVLLSYAPASGALTWRVYRNSRCRPGALAGRLHPSGYRLIEIDGSQMSAHRIAYVMHTGQCIPAGFEIDHRDGDRDNNAISNLRLATTGENAQNRKRRGDNKSGYVGVTWHSQAGKWWAQIAHNGLRRSLGLHETAEAAGAAYLRAKQELHSFQPNPREVHCGPEAD